MRKWWMFFAACFFCLLAMGQGRLTGVRDTSFSVAKEFEKLKKDYPAIRLAVQGLAPGVRKKTNLVYCSNGKRNLVLDLFLPPVKSAAKHAAIIFIHGGGWRSGNKAQHHALAEALASRGYVVITPEYRLSTEALFPAAVVDLKAATRWLHANAGNYQIDTKKIAVAGFSAGGQLAALLGTTANDSAVKTAGCNPASSTLVQAIIDLDGILAFIHPESGEGDDSTRVSAATNWFGFSKTERPDVWKQASPLMHVSVLTPPTLFINSSVARMHAGRDDFQNLLQHFGVYSQVKTFAGAPHSFPLFHPWFDSTVLLMDDFLKTVFGQRNQQLARTEIVAQDGSGNYTRVQDALDAVPRNNQNPVIIYIKNGTYREKLSLDSSKPFVTLLGEDKFNTVLTWDDHTGKLSPVGDTINTYTSQTFLEAASNFTAKNITFQNTAGFSAGQAVAVQILGDRARFINCRFTGNQDVLFLSRPATRQYFEHCYIEGTTDFIFGPSTAWFEACHIHSKKNSHITAASTPKETAFGYVFNDCVLTGDTALHSVSMGRPWRPFAHVVFMNSYLGPHLKPEGWATWNNTTNHLATTYAEYHNYGPAAGTTQRLPWTKQLSDEAAKRYTLTTVLGDWNPLHEQ